MSDRPSLAAEAVAEKLCLACGLCCDGTLFKDGELQPGDPPGRRFRALGLPVVERGGKARWPQPCAALVGCRCRIYAERPVRCRQFECLLFGSVATGKTSVAEALALIREAQRRASRVRRLLAELGDTEDQFALSARFRRLRRRFEHGLGEAELVDRFGELTVAVQELNTLLSSAFYP